MKMTVDFVQDEAVRFHTTVDGEEISIPARFVSQSDFDSGVYVIAIFKDDVDLVEDLYMSDKRGYVNEHEVLINVYANELEPESYEQSEDNSEEYQYNTTDDVMVLPATIVVAENAYIGV